MIPNMKLHWMNVSIINSIAIVNSSLITPETSINVLGNPPLVSLAEDYNMRIAIDPINRDDRLRTSVDSVSSEPWNLFRE